MYLYINADDETNTQISFAFSFEEVFQGLMLGYVIVAVINKKIPLINTSVLRFPTHTHMALEKGGGFSDHFFILNVISSLHANPLALNPGTSQTGFGQVKIIKEFM